MTPSTAKKRTDADPEDPNEVEIAWSEEIERRVRSVRDEKTNTISEEEFFRRLRDAK